jgi:thioredoxin-like negative regulator of GroEL
MFGSFFGGGGGGGGFHGGGFNFNFGGGGGGGRREEPPSNPFENTEVFVLNLGSLSKFFRRSEVWLILFFKGGEKDVFGIFKELADKYYGIFKVAAVNCGTEPELCEDEFDVRDIPTVLAYSSSIKDKGEEYTGDLKNLQNLANFAVSFMESYVLLVRKDNYDEFIKSEVEKNKVLLFTAKRSTPPLFKAISKDMKGKLVFGEVRQTAPQLIKNFGVETFPSLIILTEAENYKGIRYEGPYKKDQIIKFLRDFAYNAGAKKKRASQGIVHELSPGFLKERGKCSDNDGGLCFLAILKNSEKENILEILRTLADSYKDDPISFAYAYEDNFDINGLFERDIGLKSPALVVLRAKKKRAGAYKGAVELEKIKNFIDETLGGSVNFIKMAGSLEEIAGIKSEL